MLTVLHIKSYAQYLIDNPDIEYNGGTEKINEKIFPILGMPITLFKIMNDSQEKSILKNIVDVCTRVDYVYKKLSLFLKLFFNGS